MILYEVDEVCALLLPADAPGIRPGQAAMDAVQCDELGTFENMEEASSFLSGKRSRLECMNQDGEEVVRLSEYILQSYEEDDVDEDGFPNSYDLLAVSPLAVREFQKALHWHEVSFGNHTYLLHDQAENIPDWTNGFHCSVDAWSLNDDLLYGKEPLLYKATWLDSGPYLFEPREIDPSCPDEVIAIFAKDETSTPEEDEYSE